MQTLEELLCQLQSTANEIARRVENFIGVEASDAQNEGIAFASLAQRTLYEGMIKIGTAKRDLEREVSL